MFKHSILFSSLCLTGFIASANDSLDELMSMSLEELSMLDITMETASKFEQKLSDIPASVYVLSGERILRSGASTIAEALSLVPGVYFSKWNENSFHVSSRGFHDGLYNKMLVMVDGRSVYSPIYGGVYWSTLDYILADIDRIEVLRGPSGAVWGGNAANGVINIITKPAAETQGTYLSATGGRYEAYDLSVRQGFQTENGVSARTFFKTRNNPNYLSHHTDHWRTDTAGIVVENDTWAVRAGGTKTSTKEYFNLVEYDPSDPYNLPIEFKGGDRDYNTSSVYAQFTYATTLESGDKLNTSLWIDHVDDESLEAPGKYTTLDVEVNYLAKLSERHELLLGAGYRYVDMEFGSHWLDTDLFKPSIYLRMYDIDGADDYIANVFVQSDYQWTDKLSSVLGLKVEHFEQNGETELAPQARMLYQFTTEHSGWVGVGRGVVSPSYMDSNAIQQWVGIEEVGGDLYGLTFLTMPNRDLSTESVWTYEIGYRFQPSSSFELDATAFYSRHKNIRAQDCNTSFTLSSYEHLRFCFINDDYGASTKGVELASRYAFNEQLSLYATYSYLTVDAKWQGGALSNGEAEAFLSLPKQHMASIQSVWDISRSWQWDFIVRYHDIEYPSNPNDNTLDELDPHFTVDTRLGWQMNERSPTIEIIAQKVFAEELYDSWSLYPNEQLYFVRLSHEF